MSASVVLLCEDLQTDMFLRSFLRRRFGRRFGRQIGSAPFAAGKGSGEQRVREQFPDQLEKIRERRGAALIVVPAEPAPVSLVEACREYPRLTRLLRR